MICGPTCLSWESGEFPRPLNTPTNSHSLCPPSLQTSRDVQVWTLSLCFWPPMPIATQAAGVQCICLIIIRLDRGVLKMKEANHRAPLSKVCLPDWGVLDLSPLSPLSRGIHLPPHHLYSITHTHTQSYFSSRAASTQHNRRQWTLVHSLPPPPATPLIHSQLQNCRNTPHLHILKDFRLSSLFFSPLTCSAHQPIG